MIKKIFTVGLSIILVGCNPYLITKTSQSVAPKKTSTTPAVITGITGTKWKFSDLHIYPVNGGYVSSFYYDAFPLSKRPYIIFEAGMKKVSGFDGCNSFNGDLVHLGGDRYQFPSSGSTGTLMGCDNNSMEGHFSKLFNTGFVIGPSTESLILEGRVENKDYRLTFVK